jgi:hypothetical protein
MAAPGMDSAWFQDKKGRCWQVAIGGKVTDKVGIVIEQNGCSIVIPLAKGLVLWRMKKWKLLFLQAKSTTIKFSPLAA